MKKNHFGEENAATSRELEIIFGVSGKELRNVINTLRQNAVPIGSSGAGYFYITNKKELRTTISHMTRRIAGISAAIHGLVRAEELYDTDQMCLPLDGGGNA